MQSLNLGMGFKECNPKKSKLERNNTPIAAHDIKDRSCLFEKMHYNK
jgi:hypothetical protein